MQIVVTGDTHLPSKTRELPKELLRACEAADLVIHTGDWSRLEVYDQLAKYGKVIGVHGNVDFPEVKERFPANDIVQAKNFRIGVVHGHGEKMTTEKRALETFRDELVDIIIFGHSHIPVIRYFGGVLLVNPGSPTYKRKLPYYSYGVLELGETIEARLVTFS